MIRNAVGTVISRMTVAATTNRTIGRFAARVSIASCPNAVIRMISAAIPTTSSGTRMNRNFPGRVSRFQPRETTVIANDLAHWAYGSLIYPAHDRIERGHDCHGVGDEMPRHHQPDRLQMQERRVVDPHPERLVRSVTDRVDRVLPSWRLDARVGATRTRPKQPRQLRHHRAVGHLVQALVDDAQALLDLVHPQEVTGEAVTLLARRDVEIELRVDAVRVGTTHVERDPGRPEVRS